MKLYHYCCRHSIGAILRDKGTLKPNPLPGRQVQTELRAREWGYDDVPIWVYPVVWVTDIDIARREDAMKVGLGQIEGNFTNCFRPEVRFRGPNVGLVPWKQWADQNVQPEQFEHRAALEESYGADPSRWWVTSRPITGCRLDHSYHAEPGYQLPRREKRA